MKTKSIKIVANEQFIHVKFLIALSSELWNGKAQSNILPKYKLIRAHIVRRLYLKLTELCYRETYFSKNYIFSHLKFISTQLFPLQEVKLRSATAS